MLNYDWLLSGETVDAAEAGEAGEAGDASLKHSSHIWVFGWFQALWSDVRKLMGGTNANVPYIISSQGKKLYSDKEKEQEFQQIWKNVFRISPADNIAFDSIHERQVNNHMNFNKFQIESYERTDLDRLDPDNYLLRPVTESDIINIIKDFKHKAPGASGINKILLMNIPKIAITKYKDIINATISMGYFPIILKNGIIILIPKPGKDAKDPINYRPITLLELPGKILERILNNRFQKYCEENRVFHDNQYGFRRGRGTDIAITKIYEKVAINQKEKDHCNIVCHDVSKAFDKIWLEGLKYKITKQQQLPQLIKKVLSSYVTNRTAQIRINTHLGNLFQLESGVPQGGILSPTLFIFYTSDIPRSGPNCEDVLFADDITQIIENTDQDKEQLVIDTERQISRINNYERKWKIMTNTTKFKILSISKTRPIPIQIDNRIIPFANECSILGLKIKRTGTVSHLTDRNKLARGQSQKLRRFANLKENTKLHLYKALVRPILEYPVIPNALASRKQIINMQRTQNQNLRLVAKNTDNRDKTIQQLHEHYNVEAVNVRLHRQANKLWNKFQLKETNVANISLIQNQNTRRDHNWWPRAAKKLCTDEPEPIYT